MTAPEQTDARPPYGLDAAESDVAQRLQLATDMMREISVQTDPQEMVRAFGRRMESWIRRDRVVSLSRRGLAAPKYYVTRSSTWTERVNPWTQKSKLPILAGGLLGELLYGDELRVIDQLEPDPRDATFEYLKDMRSLVAVPLYDGGQAANMVVMLSARPGAFDHAKLPDLMIQANLFGRATQNLVLASQLHAANAEMDREMHRIGQLQRALLPPSLPDIPGVSIAVAYETATRAGGDYYDFFDLGDGRWGILIGDVSGHGASAAVVMAITRTLLHSQRLKGTPPDQVLYDTNARLARQSERYDTTFVTAFYGVYEPASARLHYSSAGHNPPLLMRLSGEVLELDRAQSFPLGIAADWERADAELTLRRGDTLLLYTDGITEAFNPTGEMYGRERLHACMCEPSFSARGVLDCILGRLYAFTDGAPAQDDRTLLALRLRSTTGPAEGTPYSGDET
ncbi:MAG: serine/threonine-protein phosphatase [Phycisphaerales bacterium]|nr:MAG: serine/threonine-protein phosphatase [Phycisphaerales bacterium]